MPSHDRLRARVLLQLGLVEDFGLRRRHNFSAVGNPPRLENLTVSHQNPSDLPQQTHAAGLVSVALAAVAALSRSFPLSVS